MFTAIFRLAISPVAIDEAIGTIDCCLTLSELFCAAAEEIFEPANIRQSNKNTDKRNFIENTSFNNIAFVFILISGAYFKSIPIIVITRHFVNYLQM